MKGSTIIGIVICILVTVISVVLGVYFSGVTCPDFGSDCSGTRGTPPVLCRNLGPVQARVEGATLISY